MKLTEAICRHRVDDIRKQIGALFDLPPSQTMQQTGNVFIGDYLLIDNATKVVYRREQFLAEDSLPVEYIVPDRRYTQETLNALFQRSFTCHDLRYVQAGRWECSLPSLHKNAKEILAVFKKKSSWWQLFK